MNRKMDKRKRLLVVEDIANMRDAWCAAFRLEEFRTDGAANLNDARRAIDRTSYHVALVDIMLAGPRDVSDRGGVGVIEYLHALREQTQCVVISGQSDDITLVRDLLKDFAIFDYIEKKNVKTKGNDFVIERVKAAADLSRLSQPLKWDALARSLLADTSADGRAFFAVEHRAVSSWMSALEFRGGFENFSNSLVALCQHLVPLVPHQAAASLLNYRDGLGALTGLYWSKGQGIAVELIVHGRNLSREAVRAHSHLDEKNVLYERTKADLTAIAVARTESGRNMYSDALPAEPR